MREHPIPQDLTGYRFHIIGNMTLKQFVEVAAGVVVAVVFYNTNLIPIIKWPLMLLSFGVGALLAWVPFEERPLDHWVTTFFITLYRPTKFFWKKQAKIPEPFLFKPRPDQEVVTDEVDLTPARRARVTEYLSSVNEVNQPDEWEQAEATRMAEIMSTFDQVVVTTVTETKTTQRPSLTVRVRELQGHTTHTQSEVIPPQVSSFQTTNQIILDQPVEQVVDLQPAPVVPMEIDATPTANQEIIEQFDVPVENTPATSIITPTENTQSAPPNEETSTPIAETPSITNAVLEPIDELSVPEVVTPTPSPISITSTQPLNTAPTTSYTVAPASSQTATATANTLASQNTTVSTKNLSQSFTSPEELMKRERLQSAQQSAAALTPVSEHVFITTAPQTMQEAPSETVAINHDLPFPTAPTTPNKVVGMVLDAQGKIVTNAIVEVKNLQGMVARAVKSNALGQFFISTPLENGIYSISAEKNDLRFSPKQLAITGVVIPPLQLTAEVS